MIRGKQYIYHVYDNVTGDVIISGSPEECGAAIGVSRNTIHRMANGHSERRDPYLRGCYRVAAELDMSPRPWMNRYTVRLSKTRELVADGTAEECARQLGLGSTSNFYKLVAYAQSREPHTKYIVRITKGGYA